MSNPSPMPDAWSDLIKGLTLLAREQTNRISPLHCEHDTLYVCSDFYEYTIEEIAELEALGFFAADGGGFMSFRFGSA